MSVIAVDVLTKEVSAEAPGGVDVEFDPAYFELEKLAAGTPESVMGDVVKPAEDPDWREVKKASLALLEKSRDLRVAMILITALLKEDGLVGFREGLGLIRGFVEKLWDHFHPKLDPEDKNDPTIRVNILKGFDGDGSPTDLYKLKLRLREAVLTNSQQRIGRFCYRDIQFAKGEIPMPPPVKGGPEVKPPDMNLINAAFEDTKTEDLQATQKVLQESLDDVAGIDAGLAKKIGPGVGPDFTALKEVLGHLKAAIAAQLAKRGAGEPEAGEPAAAGEKGPAAEKKDGGAARPAAISGDVNSREDVLRVLDKICDYYARQEPASPVPIFMQRAKRLVKMSFSDLIKDLAPEAMQKIDMYSGTAPDKAAKK